MRTHAAAFRGRERMDPELRPGGSGRSCTNSRFGRELSRKRRKPLACRPIALAAAPAAPPSDQSLAGPQWARSLAVLPGLLRRWRIPPHHPGSARRKWNNTISLSPRYQPKRRSSQFWRIEAEILPFSRIRSVACRHIRAAPPRSPQSRASHAPPKSRLALIPPSDE